MLGRAIALALLGTTFTNSCIYEHLVLAEQATKMQNQTLQSEELILKSTTKADFKNKLINANLNIPFQIKVNQTAIIKSERIKIKFVDVTEDSRCPSNVVCIWAGQVTIAVNIVKNNFDFGNFSLINYVGKNKTIVNFDGYSIKFIKVLPAPQKVGQTIKKSDYIVTLVVSKI